MGADLIVLPTPVPYECLGFQQGCEDFSVDEFIPQFVVEGLHIPVLPGTPQFDKQSRYSQRASHLRITLAVNSGPLSDRRYSGIPPEDEEMEQLVNDVFRVYMALRHYCQALPRILIKNRQYWERSTIGCSSSHEIVAPYMILVFRAESYARAIIQP